MKKTAYIMVALLIMLSLPGQARAAAKGPTFTKVISNSIVGIYISPGFSDDKMLFAITKDQDKNNGLYRSKDGGLSWAQNKLFIDGFSKDFSDNTLILCDLVFAKKGSTYLSLYDKDRKIYSFVKSDDQGGIWKTINNNAFYNLIYTGDSFWGIDRATKRLQKSDSTGGKWFLKSDVPLRNSSMATADGQYILCICNKTTLMSSNNSGQSWDAVNGVGTDITDVFFIPDHERNMYIASDSSKVMKAYISMDSGKSWELMQFGSENKAKITCAAGLPGGIIVIGTNSNKVLISQDYGKTWTIISAGISGVLTDIHCVSEGDSIEIFAGTSAGLFDLHYTIEEKKEIVQHQEIKFTVGRKVYSVAGETRHMESSPFINKGRVYIPLRYLGEALGAQVSYDETKGKATLIQDKIKVVVPSKGKEIDVNGKTVTMDAAPIIKDGRLMLPASCIAEAFGYSIEWLANTNTVRIY